ncbi:MAG TPA: hypothetical protein VLI05_00480 [Candidatus Saccharimonadia bacterium]|nr:hypothetical protein [Candidatus Saccharimonadia bacterium]
MPGPEQGQQPSEIKARLSGSLDDSNETRPNAMQELYNAAQATQPTAEAEAEAVGDVSRYERGTDVQLPDEHGALVRWSVVRSANEADPEHAGKIQVSYGDVKRWVSGDDLAKALRPAEELGAQSRSIADVVGPAPVEPAEATPPRPDIASRLGGSPASEEAPPPSPKPSNDITNGLNGL